MQKKTRILGNKERFSQSVLWKLQEEAYSQFGPQAWGKHGVPFYLTSNPFIAKRYANLVFSYIRDCLKENSLTPINFAHPFYILDLGAGTGRFGYLFLKEFLPLISQLELRKVKIRYIMTDAVISNIEYCQKHPLLQEYVKSGVLDFVYYHHTFSNQAIKTINSNEILTPEIVKNPMVLIANYFFDTIPQDLFRIHNGKLEEGKITLSLKAHEKSLEQGSLHPDIIKDFECSYEYVVINDPENYYKDFEEANQVLRDYSKHFQEITFLLPLGAFESIRYFSRLSKGKLLLLAADQGFCTEKQVQNGGEPKISRHGSFSIVVNYHAISQFFHHLKGFGMLPVFSVPLFVVTAAVLGGERDQYLETSHAFHDQIEAFQPVDYWKLVELPGDKWKELPLDYLLEIIKLGNWDPINFHAFFEKIREEIPKAPLEFKQDLKLIIEKVYKNFYPIHSNDGDFVLNLGVLLFEMKYYQEAINYFQKSLEITGDKAQTYMNMAICYKLLGNEELAIECLKKYAKKR